MEMSFLMKKIKHNNGIRVSPPYYSEANDKVAHFQISVLCHSGSLLD